MKTAKRQCKRKPLKKQLDMKQTEKIMDLLFKKPETTEKESKADESK